MVAVSKKLVIVCVIITLVFIVVIIRQHRQIDSRDDEIETLTEENEELRDELNDCSSYY